MDTIDSELTFLLSRKEIKMAKVKIDFDNDVIHNLGKILMCHLPQVAIILSGLVAQIKLL